MHRYIGNVVRYHIRKNKHLSFSKIILGVIKIPNKKILAGILQILSAVTILFLLNIFHNYVGMILSLFLTDMTEMLRFVTVDTPYEIAFYNNIVILILSLLAVLLAILEYKGEEMAAGWKRIALVILVYLFVFGIMGLMTFGIIMLVFDFTLLSSTSFAVLHLREERTDIFKEGVLGLYSKLSSIITKVIFILIPAWLLVFPYLLIFTEYLDIGVKILLVLFWVWELSVVFNSIGYIIIGVTSIAMGRLASEYITTSRQ